LFISVHCQKLKRRDHSQPVGHVFFAAVTEGLFESRDGAVDLAAL
jgi:hypothetical protein